MGCPASVGPKLSILDRVHSPKTLTELNSIRKERSGRYFHIHYYYSLFFYAINPSIIIIQLPDFIKDSREDEIHLHSSRIFSSSIHSSRFEKQNNPSPSFFLIPSSCQSSPTKPLHACCLLTQFSTYGAYVLAWMPMGRANHCIFSLPKAGIEPGKNRCTNRQSKKKETLLFRQKASAVRLLLRG